MSAFIVGIVSWIYFLFFQAQGIYGGDSGDVVTAASIFGVPHPPGYPLYTALGWVLNQLPVFTPAWRVGLLSSIPHATTVALLYAITYRLTKNRIAALFSALTIVGNYVFFLYSVTPEVFALLDVLFIATWYALIRWQETPKRVYIFIVSLLMGLSFSHHHMMVLLVPTIMYVLAPKIRRHDRLFAGFVAIGGLVIGALWYLYVPFAAVKRPIIDWDHVTTVSRMIQLITRQDYGTFQSSGSFGESIAERVIAVKAYIDFVRLDIGLVFLLGIIGIFHLWNRQRRLAITILVSLVLFGPLFFFYASFPLINRFTLATFERFMLPTYLLFTLLSGIGVSTLLQYIRHRSVQSIACIVLLVLPVLQIYTQHKIFDGLRSDRTADHFGMDVLSSLPEHAVLLLSQDTALFITQYVRYALGVRPDTAVIHTSMLGSEEYQQTINQKFPQLRILNGQEPFRLRTFVAAHATESGVFANVAFALPDGWYWVPHGLLLQALPSHLLPEVDIMYRKNTALWKTYQQPHTGILSRYKHMMLSDIANVYTNARIEFANALTKAGKYQDALHELDEAITYEGDSSSIEAHIQRGAVRSMLKDCSGALEDYQSARTLAPFEQNELYLYESVTFRSCVGDAAKADELNAKYLDGKRRLESPLEGPRHIP